MGFQHGHVLWQPARHELGMAGSRLAHAPEDYRAASRFRLGLIWFLQNDASIPPAPVFIQTGEVAGLAAALTKQEKTTVAKLDRELLLQTLVERRHLVSFFNDIKVTELDSAVPAAQYFAAHDFFPDYNARLDEPRPQAVRTVWRTGFEKLHNGTLDPPQLAVEALPRQTVTGRTKFSIVG